MNSVLGVAHMMYMGGMDTEEERIEKAEEQEDDDEHRDAIKEKLDLTSYFCLPQEHRKRIIDSMRRDFKKLCVDLSLSEMEAHDDAALKRCKDSMKAELSKWQNRSLNYKKFEKVVIMNEASLKALVSSNDPVKDKIERLCDQVRVRTHVYRQAKSELIAFGKKPNESNEDHLQRLISGVLDLISKPLPTKPPCPPPYPERGALSAPTNAALQLTAEYTQKVSDAWIELLKLTESGTFHVARQSRSRAHQGAIAPEDMTLCGVEFKDDGILWQVVNVTWSAIDNEPVVWYHDIEAAKLAGVDVETLKAHTRQYETGQIVGAVPACLEYSSVWEVRDWIEAYKNSRK